MEETMAWWQDAYKVSAVGILVDHKLNSNQKCGTAAKHEK